MMEDRKHRVEGKGSCCMQVSRTTQCKSSWPLVSHCTRLPFSLPPETRLLATGRKCIGSPDRPRWPILPASCSYSKVHVHRRELGSAVEMTLLEPLRVQILASSLRRADVIAPMEGVKSRGLRSWDALRLSA